MAATAPAISLHAWSTKGQGADDRDSLPRQQQACNAFVERHNLELIATPTLAGVSAYRGEGSFRGRLVDDLIAERRNGQIPDGCVLVVEELSRLTRKNPVDVLGGVIRDLWDSGFALGICQLNLLIDGERARRETHLLHSILAAAQVSYEESLRKSERSKSAWKGAVAAAKEGKVRRKGVCPYWLRWSDDSNGWVETKYAATIRRIYDLSADGMGVARIAGLLNEEGVESYAGRNKQFSFRLVHKILRDITVTGVWKGRDGEVIAEDYYLPIVTKAQFEQVQQGLQARHRDRSHRQCKVGNLLQGLTVCEHCGSKMSYLAQQRGGRLHRYLGCNGVREKRCNVKLFKYDERWLLKAVLSGHWQEWFEANAHSTDLDDAQAVVDRLRLEQAADQKRLKGMEQRYSDGFAADSLTVTDMRLQSAAIEKLSELVAERAEHLQAAESTLKRLSIETEQLDADSFVARIKEALDGSPDWGPDERLTFNRWLADQGVKVELAYGISDDLDFLEIGDERVPSGLDWWITVSWRGRHEIFAGSSELESWIEQVQTEDA